MHYNRFRHYEPHGGRFVSRDPIGFAGGTNSHLYANGSPTTSVDPLGLVHWSGTAFSLATQLPGSPTFDTYTLSSECINGQKAIVRISTKAIGAGVGFSIAGSKVNLEDSYDYINELALVGPYFKYSAGIATGIGISYSRVLLGTARSVGWGSEGGLDISASAVAGISDMVWQTRVKCDCLK